MHRAYWQQKREGEICCMPVSTDRGICPHDGFNLISRGLVGCRQTISVISAQFIPECYKTGCCRPSERLSLNNEVKSVTRPVLVKPQRMLWPVPCVTE